MPGASVVPGAVVPSEKIKPKFKHAYNECFRWSTFSVYITENMLHCLEISDIRMCDSSTADPKCCLPVVSAHALALRSDIRIGLDPSTIILMEATFGTSSVSLISGKSSLDSCQT